MKFRRRDHLLDDLLDDHLDHLLDAGESSSTGRLTNLGGFCFQKMGSVHGEELPFVFGAPLVDGFGHFPRNYTRFEVALSESVVQYFANFVRTG